MSSSSKKKQHQKGRAAGKTCGSGGSGGSGGKVESTFDAAKKGDVDFIQNAVLSGVNVNEKDTNGERSGRVRTYCINTGSCKQPIMSDTMIISI